MEYILETHKNFDILFIQEPPWSFICSILSSSNEDGESVGAPNHPNWITFLRSPNDGNDNPHVISYINIRLSHMRRHF